MNIAADEAWVAAARERAQKGTWERDGDALFAELREQAEAMHASRAQLPGCPSCVTHPSMVPFPRYELVSMDPFLYCGACYGFWAIGDPLGSGIADPGFDHPAMRAAPAPRRCKECMGFLKPDNVCAKCGKAPGTLNCPSCAQPMERFSERGIFLDQCSPCRGTWFDTGEIAAVYQLVPPQGLAMSTVDEHATDEELPGWLLAAGALARAFLPFLPL